MMEQIKQLNCDLKQDQAQKLCDVGNVRYILTRNCLQVISWKPLANGCILMKYEKLFAPVFLRKGFKSNLFLQLYDSFVKP